MKYLRRQGDRTRKNRIRNVAIRERLKMGWVEQIKKGGKKPYKCYDHLIMMNNERKTKVFEAQLDKTGKVEK